jgi:hypothetical protein
LCSWCCGIRIALGLRATRKLDRHFDDAENKGVRTVPLTDWLGSIFMSFRGPKALNDRL